MYSSGGPIHGAREALGRLRSRNLPYRLVTNTTSRSRALLLERLARYGFEVSADELFTATMAGVEVARTSGWRLVAPFVPEAALADMTELELVGGTSGRGAGDVPEAVILGDLGERWSYALLQEAFEYLMGGASLIALSRDRFWLREGKLALDAGPFVAGLEFAVGRNAIVAGKPSSEFYGAALRSMSIGHAETAAMVGDDLWSDVQGAQQAGLQGWLVRTGKYREASLAESGIEPDRVLDSIAALG